VYVCNYVWMCCRFPGRSTLLTLVREAITRTQSSCSANILEFRRGEKDRLQGASLPGGAFKARITTFLSHPFSVFSS
jgi:hypothetical protein